HHEHVDFALQDDIDDIRYIVGDQRRHADAEIDIISIAQFLCGARCHLIAGPGHQTSTPVAAGVAAVSRLRVVRCSMRLGPFATSMMRLTKMPGVWISSGSSCPAGTRCSTSATVSFAAVASTGLKLRAGLR